MKFSLKFLIYIFLFLIMTIGVNIVSLKYFATEYFEEYLTSIKQEVPDINFDLISAFTKTKSLDDATIEEYKKQQIWYGKSYLRYMNIIIREQRRLLWKFFRVFVKNVLYLFAPILIIVTFFISRWLLLLIVSILIVTFLLGLYRSPERNIKRLLFLIWRSFFEGWYFMQGLASGLLIKR